MKRIGLTGGIATGKSTVAALLKEKGAVIIDADIIARELVEPGRPAWQEIVDWLGRDILHLDGSINRERLGALVFSDEPARRKLNAILHPRVGQEMALRAEAARAANPQTVLVYDVPLLIEAGMQQAVDQVLLVYSSHKTQLRRLLVRDNLTREEALKRIRSQMPIEEKKKYAHAVIDNSGSRAQTARQVEDFWAKMVRQGE